MTPTAKIKERRNNLKGLSHDFPDDLTESVYTPLYDEKLISSSIWPNLDELGKALTNRRLKWKTEYFRDLTVLRQSVKVESENDAISVMVFTEYISPSLLLELQEGRRAAVDVILLKRAAGHIGFVKAAHDSVDAETLDEAVLKIRDVYHRVATRIDSPNVNQTTAESNSTFDIWLAEQKSAAGYRR